MKKLKVAIIGAGASGFASAEVLRQDSRFEITIFERNDYVGGKCLTVFTDGKICNGKSGGYEMGAVLVSKHAKSYRDLIELIEKYNIPLEVHEEKTRDFSIHLRNGKPHQDKTIDWSELFKKPKSFWNDFRRVDKYALDYAHYSGQRHYQYANRPKALNKTLSKVYGKPILYRTASVMQGFGYADLDDKRLTPPVLYYHQYIDPVDVVAPLYRLPNGTQGIWSTIAASYPKSAIKLNQEVQKVIRSGDKIKLTANDQTYDFDYLIVATPLKPTLKYLDLNREEQNFLAKMKHNPYVTILAEVEGLAAMATFDILACSNRKRIGDVLLGYKRYPDSNWAALYLYLKPGQEFNQKTILKQVERSLDKNYHAKLVDPSSVIIRYWEDYFGHLDTKSLNAKWYEEFDKKFQNQKHTLFVSSGLHMETVGASVEYATAKTKEFIELLD